MTRTIKVMGAISVVGAALVVGSVGAFAKPQQPQATVATCTVSAAAVGAPLDISGTGYQPDTSYEVEITWPDNAGISGIGVWSDGSGDIFVSEYAYWSGTYQVAVYSTKGNHSLLASCSTTVS